MTGASMKPSKRFAQVGAKDFNRGYNAGVRDAAKFVRDAFDEPTIADELLRKVRA